MTQPEISAANRAGLNSALKHLDDAAEIVDLRKPEDERDFGPSVVEQRRRGRRRLSEDEFGTISLVDEDGVLRWQEGLLAATGAGRRTRRGVTVSGEIVRQYKFEKLGPNKVGELLVNLDAKLTPNQGLRRVRLGSDKRAVLEPVARPSARKRALVIVHGTFSNAENLLRELEVIPEGREFLARVTNPASGYDEVLSFNHPTLSVSPLVNALDLAGLFAECPAEIDVICHSRGGLVTRWWLEGLNRGSAKAGKVVAVASPLGGTSLAAPPRLCASLDFITNVGRALEATGTAAMTISGAGAPFMAFAVGLVKVLTSITGFASSIPLIDAGVAMIPGLSGQSRVSNNLELLRLMRQRARTQAEYFSVMSNFVPSSPGWKFWKLFVNIKDRALNLGADLVFDQENDLVVDTRSMTELFKDGDNVLKRVSKSFDFGDQERVHHTNYFRQPETVKFMRESLKV